MYRPVDQHNSTCLDLDTLVNTLSRHATPRPLSSFTCCFVVVTYLSSCTRFALFTHTQHPHGYDQQRYSHHNHFMRITHLHPISTFSISLSFYTLTFIHTPLSLCSLFFFFLPPVATLSLSCRSFIVCGCCCCYCCCFLLVCCLNFYLLGQSHSRPKLA